MGLHFDEAHPFGWVPVEYPADEINDLAAEVDGEFYIYFQDLVVGFVFVSFALEGCFASADFVAENSQAPDVCSLVIELSRNNFGRHVVQGSAECLALAD